MRKIINGRKYDTETAKELGDYWNGLGENDFENFSEILYQKKTGEYFLYGEGGPASKYAEHCPGGWTSGKGIIPMTESEAMKWAEEHLDCDECEAIFGEVEE